jgi:predicted ATPase
MHITRLHVKNFKSIKEETFVFSPLTILVGANASGKSNIISVFKFISDIISDGIENAISLQGGMEYLFNSCADKSEYLELDFDIDLDSNNVMYNFKRKSSNPDKEFFGSLMPTNATFRFTLKPTDHCGDGYIVSDFAKIKIMCRSKKTAKLKGQYIGDVIATFKKSGKKVRSKREFNVIPGIKIDEVSRNSFLACPAIELFEDISNQYTSQLMLSYFDIFIDSNGVGKSLISVFDFDPKEIKKPSSISSEIFLDETGVNVSNILKRIIKSEKLTERFMLHLNSILPFVESIGVDEQQSFKSYIFNAKECYSDKPFPASFLSDGTVSIIAIILALYFDNKSNIIILEEPERNIHPKLIDSILACANEVSERQQVIITTHNPEFLKYADAENVRFIKRNKIGFTSCVLPAESKNVKIFLQNDLGLDDLFIDGLLGE